MPRRARSRRLLIILGASAAVLLLAAGALALLLSMIDLRAHVERLASDALERRVSIGGLRIGWGNPLTIAVTDLHIANADWGTVPDMVSIGALSAEIDLWALLHGVQRYDKLRVERPVIVLERGAGAGQVNWRWPGQGAPSGGGLALVPRDRRQFPTLIDMALRDGVLSYRTAAGEGVRLEFHSLAIRAAADDRPVSLTAEARYNGVPVGLRGETQPFAVLRDAATPFGTALTLTSRSANVHLDGTMTAPLDVDGIAAKLRIEADRLDDLLAAARVGLGAGRGGDARLTLAGALAKSGDHWELRNADGSLGTSRFDGTLALDEGRRGAPDHAALSLAFDTIDLQPVTGRAPSSSALDLRLDPKPGLTLEANVAVRELADGALRLRDVVLRGRTAPGRIELTKLAFAIAGGRLEASGSAEGRPDATHAGLRTSLVGADTEQLARLLGGGAGQIVGKAGGQAALETTARTLDDALAHADGQAVLVVTAGRVARALLEQASTDLRALFRKSEGSVPISCLVVGGVLHDGVVALEPLRLRAPETAVEGSGWIDLVRRVFEVTIRSEGGTSALALNVPLRIGGSFARYGVTPAIGSDAAALPRAPSHLAPELQDFVRRSGCQP